MAKRVNPTLVGAFVLGAFLLVIAGILVLGGENIFTQKRRFVIYFGDAIKGLTVGAPVTFKGVVVGRVANLKVRYVKETGRTEIPVLIDLDPNKVVTPGDDEEATRLLHQMIDQGLRAQMNPESLITNQQVVQLDFFPGTPVRLIESNLPYPQIPSLPSSFDQLQASIGMAAQSPPDLAASATLALNQISSLLTPANQQKVSHILDNVEVVTSNLAAHGADLGKTLVSLQQASEELNRVLKGLDATLADNRKPAGELVVKLNNTADSVKTLTDTLNGMLAENRTGVADFANGSLYDLGGLISDSRQLVRRANDTLDQLDRDPSRFLFGNNNQGVPAK
ncbi:MAG TPA: MlaD family protein [Magnetospirillaceae bacterium]|nr:MlaD family protein [Magnetospirillaceae bacterium]